MSKKNFSVVMGVALAMVLAVGGVIASNMGFKLNYLMQKPTGGVSLTGKSALSLPYNRQTGMNNSKNLLDDIDVVANITNIQRHVRSTDVFQAYTGRGASATFALAAGEGYFVRLISADKNYIAVGSHNPTASILLQKPAAGVSLTGKSFYAPPYHTTSVNSKNLLDELGGVANVTNVQRHVRSTDVFQAYTGRGASATFALVPGEAYMVRLISADVNLVPAHY
jgi:hypothetical protein